MGLSRWFSRKLKELKSRKQREGEGTSLSATNSPSRSSGHHQPRLFTFRELSAATKNFRQQFLLGMGGFGSVYKGRSRKTGQLIAVKHLNRRGLQGQAEFLVEILMLSLLQHSNIIRMFGYCDDGVRRLIVYEYMPLGSLEDHLHDLTPDMLPLDWNTRMKIAAGIARGLNYLHNEAIPPVIYGDMKPSNVLLGDGFQPKISDFGLAKFGDGENWNLVSNVVSSAPNVVSNVASSGTTYALVVTGTAGYVAPECSASGTLTVKSDIYSFGVLLLELLTGREAMELDANQREESIVEWARKKLRFRTILDIADPLLQENFKLPNLSKAMTLALSCVQDDPDSRPNTATVLQTLESLAAEAVGGATLWGSQTRTPERGSGPSSSTLNPNTSGRRRAYSR
ncbi:probable serine/threonine-protein kinase PBL7 [Sesamum indicum]|uniref:Probable serine/threonine-protein kinase PBL7 n=1 Tax=Sesamum indicum TaxID=4182 RepID=A0A6I9UJ59_SESIN|nr:probable serine/threonine-protein kinase PBL7 [Sesamum indicum]